LINKSEAGRHAQAPYWWYLCYSLANERADMIFISLQDFEEGNRMPGCEQPLRFSSEELSESYLVALLGRTLSCVPLFRTLPVDS
jgi:hypothetical protein